jgi:hypothetical protein
VAYGGPQGRAGQTGPAVVPAWGVTWRENCPHQHPLALYVSPWVLALYFVPGGGNEGVVSLPSSLIQSVGKMWSAPFLNTHTHFHLSPPGLGEGAHRQGEKTLPHVLQAFLSLRVPLPTRPGLVGVGKWSLSMPQGFSVWESVRVQLTLCRAWAGVPMGKPRRRTMHGALEMMRTK